MEKQTTSITNNRLLIVDDNQSIHSDFRKILSSTSSDLDKELSELEKVLLNSTSEPQKCDTEITYHIDSAYQGEEAIQKVEAAEKDGKQYAVIFMDVRMPPGMNGIEAIEKIWKINNHIEVVICTAYSDYSWDDIIKKVGSTDKLLFLKKPFYSIEVRQMALSLIIKRNLNEQVNKMVVDLEGEVKDRTVQLENVMEELRFKNSDLEEKNRILSNMVERDSLTGLYNHAAFHKRLAETFDASKRHRFPFSLMMLDIDNFKTINDSFGHQIGDEVLIKISEIISREVKSSSSPDLYKLNEAANVRKYDVAARYGGDEFAIIFPYCSKPEMEKIASRISQKFSELKLHGNYPVSASIGVAVMGAQTQFESPKQLVQTADKALYSSKANGKNCLQIYENAI